MNKKIVLFGLVLLTIFLSGCTKQVPLFIEDNTVTATKGELDGGFANSIYLSTQHSDSGFANSTYLSTQHIDGGNANG